MRRRRKATLSLKHKKKYYLPYKTKQEGVLIIIVGRLGSTTFLQIKKNKKTISLTEIVICWFIWLSTPLGWSKTEMYSNRSIDSSFRFGFTIGFLVVFFPIDILWDHLFDMLFIIVNPRVGGYRETTLMRNYTIIRQSPICIAGSYYVMNGFVWNFLFDS